MTAMTMEEFRFTDSASLKGREDKYQIVRVGIDAVLKSWRSSLFSFEWLTPEGKIRSLDDLPLHERDKRLRAEKTLKETASAERPVLGIGLLDNVEIGAGREIFLTLAAQGVKHVEVHIPASCAKAFKEFIIP